MFSHILVPLDGSRLAESAIPPAAVFASWFGAAVTLLHVVEKDAPRKVHGDRHLTSPEEAVAYLKRLARSAFPPGAPVSIHVHESPVDRVAESITSHSGELAPDLPAPRLVRSTSRGPLIVMCTHCGGGIRERIFGSIAQKVVASGTIPVLLVRPDGENKKPSFSCRTILLPLDADEAHERGFEAAVETARVSGADLRLVMVVPTLGTLDSERAETGRLLPGTTRHLLALAEDHARAHLMERMKALESLGIPLHASVRRGDPAEMIVATARETASDLVVLGTHGRSGFGAFWSESVAPRIVAALDIPILLVPVGEL